MLINDKVLVDNFYITSKTADFIGVLPVHDVEQHSYYTVENYHEEAEFSRVSPVFGIHHSTPYSDIEYMVESPILSLEEWKKDKPRGTYPEYVESYNSIKKNMLENPYILRFVGCDDGDIVMRFPDKESAMHYLEKEIVYFDEVYEDKRSMTL